MALRVAVELRLIQIIAVAAQEIAPCPGRFEHHIDGMHKRRDDIGGCCFHPLLTDVRMQKYIKMRKKAGFEGFFLQ